MKAIKQYFPVMLFIMLEKMVVLSESVDEIDSYFLAVIFFVLTLQPVSKVHHPKFRNFF